MVLVDTNIIIDIWKNPDNENTKIFTEEEVCICGVVRSELMHGAFSEKNLHEISNKLDYLKEYNIKENEWSEFGKFLFRLRTNGITLPYADALIAFIAIRNDIQVLTKDKHFEIIRTVEPMLKLYEG